MSTLTDIDYAILMTKITALESRVSKLESGRQEEAPWQSDDPNAPYYREPYITYDDIIKVL